MLGVHPCAFSVSGKFESRSDAAEALMTVEGAFRPRIRLIPGQCFLSLRFPGPFEERYMHHHKAVFTAQDWTACWMHLAMQAPGFLTIVLASTCMPELWTPSLAGCGTYTATMFTVSMLHFLLLVVLPPGVYKAHRESIVTVLRVLYMFSSVIDGLQRCSTVTKWWSNGGGESPLSAFIWRAGLIAMLWPTAYRLPFWYHLQVQNATAIANALLLAEAVCETLPGISHGAYLVSLGHSILHAVGTVWELLTFLVSGTLPGASDMHAAAQASTSQQSSISPDHGTCLLVVRTWQVLVGNILIGALLYYLEAADRAKWWDRHVRRSRRQCRRQESVGVQQLQEEALALGQQ